jgi:maltoporin
MCSVCNYKSYDKRNAERHVQKKIACGTGERTLIVSKAEIKCDKCSKNFSNLKTLKYHQKHNCNAKISVLEEQLEIANNKIKELEQTKQTTNNNITNNYNGVYNIYINNYLDTKIDHITDNVYAKIIRECDEPHQIIPRLIKEIHFDENHPENHNIFISNRSKHNKYLHIYDNGWKTVDKEAEISNLINDKETILIDWAALVSCEQFPEVEIFRNYLEQKYDKQTAGYIQDEVHMVLYNYRGMIKQKT